MKKGHRELGEPFLRRLLTGLALIFVLLYVGFVLSRYWEVIVSYSHLDRDFQNLAHHLSKANLIDFCVLIILTAMGSAVPFLSNGLLAIFNGIVFGPWLALIMNLLANVLGNWLMILVLRKISLVGHEQVFTDKLAILERIHEPYLAICIGYMIPIFPTLLVNYLVIKGHLETRYWLVSVLIGVFPTSCLYAFGGDAIIRGNIKRLFFILLFVVFSYLSVKVMIKRMKT